MTEDEALAQATQQIEEAKPMYAQVNNEVNEYTEAEYDQAIVDLKNYLLDEYNNGYKRAREQAYLPITEQLDQLYWAIDSGLFGDDAKTSQWYLDIKTVKTDNPKPS